MKKLFAAVLVLVLLAGMAVPAFALEPVAAADPPGKGGHRYLVDGIRLDDILPAQEAVLQNADFAIRNGFGLFAVVVGVFLITRIMRSFFGFGSGERFVDHNQPSGEFRRMSKQEQRDVMDHWHGRGDFYQDDPRRGD